MNTMTAAKPRYNPAQVAGFEQQGSKKLASGKGVDVNPKTGKELPQANTNMESMAELNVLDLGLLSVTKMLSKYKSLLASGSARTASGLEMVEIRSMIVEMETKKKSIEADVKALQAKMNANKTNEQPEAPVKGQSLNPAAKAKMDTLKKRTVN